MEDVGVFEADEQQVLREDQDKNKEQGENGEEKEMSDVQDNESPTGREDGKSIGLI